MTIAITWLLSLLPRLFADPPLPPLLQIDISAYVVRTQTQLTVRNDGKAEAASLLLCDPHAQHLAYLEVRTDREIGIG